MAFIPAAYARACPASRDRARRSRHVPCIADDGTSDRADAEYLGEGGAGSPASRQLLPGLAQLAIQVRHLSSPNPGGQLGAG